MEYLVCDKCGTDIELRKGESPDDFADKCECGGNFNFVKDLDSNNNKNQTYGTFEPDYELVNNPFFGIPEEIRRDFLKDLGKKSEKVYEESLKELKTFIKNFDILDMLCHFSMYFLSIPIGVTSIEKDPIVQFHVELLQALALQIDTKNKDNQPFLGTDAVKIEKLLKKIPISLINKRMASINEEDEAERKKLFYIEMFRAHNMTVRNWGYTEQVLRLTKALFQPIDSIIQEELKISILKLIEMIELLLNHLTDKFHQKRAIMAEINNSKSLEQMIDIFIEYYPLTDKSDLLKISKEAESKEDFANYLNFVVGDQFIKFIYMFGIDDCINFYPGDIDNEVLEEILDGCSYEEGGLKDFNTDHILFGNPIWDKPLIKVDEKTYCWPIPTTFQSFIIELMENIIKKNTRIKRIYEKRRASFLEEHVENLFKNCFKNAEVYGNLIRVDEDHENDLLVIIDTHAIIVESKSGKISPPARRGAPDSLKREIEKLLVESSEQAKVFEDYVKSNLDVVEFTNKKGEKICVDLSNIKHVHTFSVTFDLFGPLASRTPLLFEVNLVDDALNISPSMTLADLEIIFEILETDSEKIHYFTRRSQLDKNTIYNADELDLLAFYVKTSFNIGETEFAEMPLELYGESEEVFNAYYLNKNNTNSKPIPKPRPKRTKWWQDIINKLEKRKNPGWSEITVPLLNVTYEDQIKFEEGLEKVKKIVDNEWMVPEHTNQVILSNETKEREYLIIGYCYKNIDRRERNDMAEKASIQAIDQTGISPALIMSFKLGDINYPYSSIGLIVKRE